MIDSITPKQRLLAIAYPATSALRRQNTYAHVLPEIERAAVDEAATHLFG